LVGWLIELDVHFIESLKTNYSRCLTEDTNIHPSPACKYFHILKNLHAWKMILTIKRPRHCIIQPLSL